MPTFRMHEPVFPDDRALYIIWCDSSMWGRFSLAAGSITAMNAAWEALQEDQPKDRLSLQNGARVPRERGPVLP